LVRYEYEIVGDGARITGESSTYRVWVAVTFSETLLMTVWCLKKRQIGDEIVKCVLGGPGAMYFDIEVGISNLKLWAWQG
jgi:hypothetical protein